MPEAERSANALESTHNMLKFYASIRELVKTIFEDR